MKKILALSAMLVAPSAYAQIIDYSVLADHGRGHRQMHICLKKAWKASMPTDQQNDGAKRFMAEAKAVKEIHGNAIDSAKSALKAAWSKHPIVQTEVVAAESALREHKMPVRDAFRDAGINSLNLLSGEQRAKFNAAFTACMH